MRDGAAVYGAEDGVSSTSAQFCCYAVRPNQTLDKRIGKSCLTNFFTSSQNYDAIQAKLKYRPQNIGKRSQLATNMILRLAGASDNKRPTLASKGASES
jgi:hypothetical protein